MPNSERTEREQLGNEIAALISGVARRYRGSFVGCAGQLGLGAGEAQALWLLSTGGEATTGELARGLGIDPANASTLLSKLERRGLIRRNPAAHDRRKRIVSHTAQGRQANRALTRCMEQSPSGFVELSTSELVTFRDLLRRIAGES